MNNESVDELLKYIEEELEEDSSEFLKVKSSVIPEDKIYQSWQEAQMYVERLHLTSNYSVAVRTVLKAKEKANEQQLRSIFMQVVFPHIIRLSPSYQAIYCFAAEEFYPEKFAALKNNSIVDVLGCFTIDELLSILILAYVSASVRKLIADENEKAQCAQRLRLHLALGRLIGNALDGYSAANGLLIGGLLSNGFSLLSIADADVFRKYRQSQKISKLNYDLKEEFRIWGCTHFQIAALLLQEFGFGGSLATGVFSEQGALVENDTEALNAWIVKELLCEIISQGTHKSQLASTVDMIGTSDWEDLLAKAELVIEQSEEKIWIDARKQDLSEEELRQLKNYEWP